MPEYSSETFEGGGEETLSRWSESTRLLTCSSGLSSTPQRFRRYLWVDWVAVFFFFRHPNFSPNIDNIYTIFGLSRKIRIPVKKITAIAVGEEVEKKIQNKERLSEHDETNMKFLKEAIDCIPLTNEDGADF